MPRAVPASPGRMELRSESPSAVGTQGPCRLQAGFRGAGGGERRSFVPECLQMLQLPRCGCGWLKRALVSALPLGRWEPAALLCERDIAARGSRTLCCRGGSAGAWPLWRQTAWAAGHISGSSTRDTCVLGIGPPASPAGAAVAGWCGSCLLPLRWGSSLVSTNTAPHSRGIARCSPCWLPQALG